MLTSTASLSRAEQTYRDVGTNYAVVAGPQILKAGTTRTPDSDSYITLYWGTAKYEDPADPSKTITKAIPWNILGPADTDIDRFKGDYRAYDDYIKVEGNTAIWGVYPSAVAATDPTSDITNNSVLAVAKYYIDESAFNSDSSWGNDYCKGETEGKPSALKSYMDNGFSTWLTKGEQSLAGYTYKVDGAWTSGENEYSYSASTGQSGGVDLTPQILNASRLFPLSAAESETYWPRPASYETTGNNLREAASIEPPLVLGAWWLRSAYSDDAGIAGGVLNDGDVLDGNVDYGLGARPASNLNLSQAVLTTDTSFVADALSEDLSSTLIAQPTLSYYATLYDAAYNNLAITSSKTLGSITSGDTISLSYKGARIEGNNDVVAAFIKDTQGKVLYCGNVSKDAEGTAKINLPQDLAPGDYSVVLLNTQDNNYKNTTQNKGKLTNLSGRISDANTASFTITGDIPTPDPDDPQPEEETGWNFNESGGWYYVYDTEGNTYNDGWHWIEDTTFGNHWYYFKENGFIATNEWIFTDAWYYVNSSGAMNVGTWNFINGAWYGFNWNGTMCKGWTFDSNYHNWFYCDPTTGAMYTNCWSFINGAWYGFWANGEMSHALH